MLQGLSLHSERRQPQDALSNLVEGFTNQKCLLHRFDPFLLTG